MEDANNVSFADYDNDGDADVMIVRDGTDLLLANDGRGRFADVSTRAGVGDDDRRGMNASWADYDNDGDLDVYVTNYMHCLGAWSTAEEVISQVAYDSDTLYRNNGDGTFSDVTSYVENDPDDYDDGTTIGAGFGASWFDYDHDGRLDLYLANDFVGPLPDYNRLWHNDGPTSDGGWGFSDVSLDTNTALFMNTMGIGVGDYDRDGDFDMALSNITANKLLRNDGGTTFTETPEAGIGRPTQEAAYNSVTWGVVFGDYNLDGWEDLYVSAGNLQQAPGVPTGAQPDEVFVNDGTGRFLDVERGHRRRRPGRKQGRRGRRLRPRRRPRHRGRQPGWLTPALRKRHPSRREPLAHRGPRRHRVEPRRLRGGRPPRRRQRRARPHRVVRIGRRRVGERSRRALRPRAGRLRGRAHDRVAVRDHPDGRDRSARPTPQHRGVRRLIGIA